MKELDKIQENAEIKRMLAKPKIIISPEICNIAEKENLVEVWPPTSEQKSLTLKEKPKNYQEIFYSGTNKGLLLQ